MAKLIHKKGAQCESKMVLKRISRKEIFEIYCQSVLIMFYIAINNLFKYVKFHFDQKVKKKILNKFRMLSALDDKRENVKGRNKNIQNRVKPK